MCAGWERGRWTTSMLFSDGLQGFWRCLRLQAADALGEKEEDARAKCDQHHGYAERDAPKRADSCATIIAPADHDMTRHRDEQLEDAAAEQPARRALHKRFRC